MANCAAQGCTKEARKRFCSDKCKNDHFNLLDKQNGTGKYAPKPEKRKAPSTVEAFKW